LKRERSRRLSTETIGEILAQNGNGRLPRYETLVGLIEVPLEEKKRVRVLQLKESSRL
jgi:hypothetical protein